MKKKIYTVILCIMMILSLVGCSKSQKTSDTNSNINILDNSYDEILKNAKGTTVNFYGYGGNEVMNKWFDTYVIPQMKEKYDIKVKRVGMNIDDIMNKLLSEKQAKSEEGVMDVVWINGENFKTAKENNLLFGAFTEKLPNFNEFTIFFLYENMSKHLEKEAQRLNIICMKYPSHINKLVSKI